MIQQTKIDNLAVRIYESRKIMGISAAEVVADKIKSLLSQREYINMTFAAAPSQNEFLEALVQDREIDWTRINAFHMDEYVGLSDSAPQRFGQFLYDHIFGKVPFRKVHYLNGNAENMEDECKRYASLLMEYPTDIVCMGIGENTHIAFNDPHVADFNDPKLVKIVDLDLECKQQQVHDGCFPSVGEVPAYAITLTVPALIKSTYVYCMVPSVNKSKAVYHTLNEEIKSDFPSTILRKHENAILFLDKESAKLTVALDHSS